MPSFFRTIWFRNSMLYALLFFTVASLAGMLTYRSVESGLKQSVLGAVTEDQKFLMSEFSAGGVKALKEAVNERLAETSGTERLYGLQETTLPSSVLGNIPAISSVPVYYGHIQLGTPSIGTIGSAVHVIGITEKFPGGQLFVGRNVSALDLTLEVLRRSFALASVLFFAAALVLGSFLGMHSERRIGSMASGMRRIVNSGMKERLAAKGSSNEYDRLARDINVMLNQLQDLMEGLRHVTTNIAHDLRTPLFRLRQDLENLQLAGEQVNNNQVAALSNCMAEVDRMNETFGALLRIAEIEDGSRRQAFREVELSDLVVELEELYIESAASAGLTLTCDFEYGVRIWGDRELLLQLAANLIENAIRHASTGGTIGLALVTHGKQAILSVSDAGPGIPATEYEKVFRRLYKRDTSRNSAGHGLGLSLVAAIADLHHASIRLSDNLPGLKVEVAFPLFPHSVINEA